MRRRGARSPTTVRGSSPGSPARPSSARRDRAGRENRALLCPQPRSWRHATNLAARARECAQAIPAPRRRPQSIVTDAPAHRRRHPAGGRGGRIWRYFRSAHAHRGHAGGTGGLAKRPDGFRRRIPPGSESRKKPLNQRAVKGPIPERPAASARRNSGQECPSAEIVPIPVTATRRTAHLGPLGSTFRAQVSASFPAISFSTARTRLPTVSNSGPL